MTQKEEQEKSTDIVEQPKQEEQLIVHDDSPNSMFMDSARFGQLWRVSSAFSRSDLVPQHFRGKAENCMISISMAFRMGVDPLMMLQNSYIVHGKPGIEAKLAIALINRSGLFTTPLQYKFEGQGKTRKCTAFATLKATGQVLEQPVSMEMAVAEGWTKKQGSKWLTLPDLMLTYRSAMFFARIYCPEVLMGMQTIEEIYDFIDDDPKTEIIDTEEIKPEKEVEQIEAPKEKEPAKKGTKTKTKKAGKSAEEKTEPTATQEKEPSNPVQGDPGAKDLPAEFDD